MKIFRLACVDKNHDFTMPNWLFWFFKKFVTVKSFPQTYTNGMSYEVVYYDEAKESEDGRQDCSRDH